MFVLNDDLSIYVTRGDIVFFNVTAEDKGVSYTFKAGDVVRMKVYGRKDADTVVLQKDFPVTRDTESVEIFLEKKDTKIGKVINKPTDYWYEIELNPLSNPQTIIGYGEDGPVLFRLFPEGRDLGEDDPVIAPEDIPVVDAELDITSKRPVENQAIAKAIVRLDAATEANGILAHETKTRFDNLVAHKDADYSAPLEYMEYITEGTKAKIDATINADGAYATITVNLREANQFWGGSGMDVFIIPAECRPIDVGTIHTEDGLEYIINYDNESGHYLLYIGATDDVTTAPESAGIATMTYALADFEVKDIRVGADGTIYPTAGEAVRKQIEDLKKVAFGTSENRPIDMPCGYMYFDTTIGKPIFFTGSNWVDATGEIV